MKLACSKETHHFSVDASQYNYGRLCSYVAFLLRSKQRIDFSIFNRMNTVVYVYNIARVNFSKINKLDNKIFYRHTGYMGGLKKRNLRFYVESNRIKECFRLSVRRMLKNTNTNQTIVEKNIQFRDE